MNPLTKVKLINELNEREAELGVKDSVSWHSTYKDSAWIFIGGFPYDLTEGDLICVFSQYGEIANINLVRDKKTGKSKGFGFICYEDQRSTILAVDNFNGIKIKGRTIRVDHVLNYRPPQDTDDIDDVTKQLREEGCAPKLPSSSSEPEEEEHTVVVKKQKKDKKEKKKKKDKKKTEEVKREEQGRSAPSPVRVKHERADPGYEKYAQQRASEDRMPRDERHGREERARRERPDDSRARERDGRAREEDRRKDRSGGGKEGDEAGSRSRDDTGRPRREDRERRTERHRREDGDRERERSGRPRDHSRDRERRRS